MREISLKEMQQIELDLLIEFDRVCKKHSLRYYIDGGTLLGAMCYEGFIPWDDDIDIKMPRPDYEKLHTLQYEFSDFVKFDLPSKHHCEYLMMKLIDDRTLLIEGEGISEKKTGIYIDVFPMDGHPSGKAFDLHVKQLQKWNSLFHLSLIHFVGMKNSKSIITKIKGYLYDFLYNPWKIYCKLESLVKKYNYDDCSEVGLLIEGDVHREKFCKEWLEPSIDLEFEGYLIPAPKEYKKHLEIFYGEHITNEEYYHNLPVIMPDHKHKVYWR